MTASLVRLIDRIGALIAKATPWMLGLAAAAAAVWYIGLCIETSGKPHDATGPHSCPAYEPGFEPQGFPGMPGSDSGIPNTSCGIEEADDSLPGDYEPGGPSGPPEPYEP